MRRYNTKATFYVMAASLYKPKYWFGLVWFGFFFNGISTFVGYLMQKPFSKKNSSGTI